MLRLYSRSIILISMWLFGVQFIGDLASIIIRPKTLHCIDGPILMNDDKLGMACVIMAGLRQEQDLYIRLIDSATKQVPVLFVLFTTDV